jgi:O-antigen/teichoic acid export membrane protein
VFRLIASIKQRLLAISQGDGLKVQLVRGALGVGGLRLLSLPLTLGTSILLARGLGPEGYGKYVFVISLTSILALPVGPGLGQLVAREVAKYQHGAEWGLFQGLLRRAHQWAIFGSAVMAAAIATLAIRSASWTIGDRWTLLLLAMLMLPLLGLNALRGATLRGLRHPFYAQLPEMLLRPALHLAIAGSLLLTGMLNPVTTLASQILATALAFGFGAWLLWRFKPTEVGQAKPSYQHREWCWALLPFTLLAAASTLNSQIGILTLGWLGANEDVSALQLAMSGAMMVALPLGIVNMVIGPHIARAQKANDKDRLQRLSRQSARASLAVALPVALPLIFFGGAIVELVYGQPYRNAARLPLAILSFGQLVNVAFGSVGMFLTMSGFERDTLRGQVVALLINVVSAMVLIPHMGAVGAALAVAIGFVTWNIVLAISLVNRLKIRPSAF